MSVETRRKPGNLQVISHQVLGRRQFVHLRLEELFLVVVTSSPCQDRADIETFAFDLPNHIFRQNSLRGCLVVATARGMDMMVAGIPTHRGQINPTLQTYRPLL